MDSHECCWHDMGVVLSPRRVRFVEGCCHCGTRRELEDLEDRAEHGPYAPTGWTRATLKAYPKSADESPVTMSASAEGTAVATFTYV